MYGFGLFSWRTAFFFFLFYPRSVFYGVSSEVTFQLPFGCFLLSYHSQQPTHTKYDISYQAIGLTIEDTTIVHSSILSRRNYFFFYNYWTYELYSLCIGAYCHLNVKNVCLIVKYHAWIYYISLCQCCYQEVHSHRLCKTTLFKVVCVAATQYTIIIYFRCSWVRRWVSFFRIPVKSSEVWVK